MKKIEKLEEFNWVSGRDAITIALCNTIIRKQNEIIDHLNTQPQAGEYPQKAKYISGEVPEEKKALVQLRRVFDKKRVKEWDRTAVETYKQATQSTPEQKEDWEEEFMEVLETFKDEICSNFFASSKPLTDFIKQLLLEREREVLNSMREWVVEYHKDNWDIRDFDAEIAIGKIIDRELDKLNKKK